MSMQPGASDSDGPAWLGLRWSAWMPLMAAHPLALAQLPAEPGVYRIRRAGTVGELVWIGWAHGSIRESVERLSRQTHLPVTPYDDPSSPALALWTQRVTAAASFEVSGAAVDPATPQGERAARKIRAYGLDRPQSPSGG